MVAVLGAASIAAHAQTASIDLPAQTLAKALAALASTSGANILASDALVANRTSPALTGQLTVHKALEQLLRGTGLQVQQIDAHTYVIVAPPERGMSPATSDDTKHRSVE
ncbi:STN domain-containing protein [Burkholderia sp. FERM BP-3421]|uniref:STN domain-containing protein n=1 Tax=Burkholderia sp. FERM BP-3421 TaxID=1494466 RepID=UPI0023620D8A|nr:STN domain-containing protein [Burkholderia sp. FERM BP-3421]WDD92107.1 STN domain-containing protein [Burkholderia sp. FERM BP-3421]